MSLSPLLLLLLLLLVCTTPTHAQTYSVTKAPLVAVVFALPEKTAPNWQSAQTFHDRLDVLNGDRSRVRKVQPSFRYAFEFSSLTYTFTPIIVAEGMYILRLGLMDPDEACTAGSRLATYSVNGMPASSTPVDIASVVGCRKPYFLDVPLPLMVGQSMSLVVAQVAGSSKLPVISNVQLFSAPSPPTPFPSAQEVKLAVDIGLATEIPGTTLLLPTGAVRTKKIGSIPPTAFDTARQGAKFSISMDVPSGTYDVTLGFAELNDAMCVSGGRVFSVWINGQVKIDALDVYTAAKNRCRRSLVETFASITVDNVDAQPLTVAFEAIAGEAIVSFIGVTASEEQCVPVTDDAERTDDHLAHSVPGMYPPFVDTTGKGYVDVRLDGSDSHTHFDAPGVRGAIRQYRWINMDQGKVISRKAIFTRRFNLGTTRLRLEVVDNICSQDNAETTITVVKSRQQGQYCYYYTGITSLPVTPAEVDAGMHPSYAAVFNSLRLSSTTLPFADATFMIRCEFLVEFTADLKFFAGVSTSTRINVKTDSTGPVKVFMGDDLILDSLTSEDSTPFYATLGEVKGFTVLYLRQDTTKEVKVNFKINGRTPKIDVVSHDKATVIPIVTALTPAYGPREGGTSVRVQGYGLIPPLRVMFGSVAGKVTRVETTGTDAFVTSPEAITPGTVSVVVQSSAGKLSKGISFEYGGACDPPQFRRLEWLTTDNEQVDVGKPTAVALWSDGRLYLGTREGRVSVVTYDAESFRVSSICYSEVLLDARYKQADGSLSPRTILGITFDPSDRKGRPYVSTSTLFWLNQRKIDPANTRGWANGNVERLKPASAETRARDPAQCLERHSVVVSGLPVGAADHSINELLFDQNGDLLIAVAGLTNGGLPGKSWGGIWETYFSGAVVRARVSMKKFNGNIEYTTPDDPTTARPVSSESVDLFATGFRNLFTLILTRDQRMYGIDMGIDCRWGNMSTSCDQYDPALEPFRNRQDSFPGTAIIDPNREPSCQYSGERSDKLLEIIENNWYGHSNLQRAAALGTTHECAWVDPKTGRVAGTNKLAPAPYKHRETLLTSPMTGLREYGANHFCGRMRGNLVIARYKETKTLRLERNPTTGSVDPTQIILSQKGALRVEENELGQLIYPRLIRTGVTVLDPIVSGRGGLFVAGAMPWRHGKKGRTLVRVGGWGFEKGVKVFIGGQRCKNRMVTSTVVTCRVPKWKGGDLLVDIKVMVGAAEADLPKSILYMNV